MGGRATEREVKALSVSGDLARARIVHFATHGLLAGETRAFGGKAEPALLLTPPATPSEEDDGLLTASEAAMLRLDADWVILSACNTAAAERPGAEALLVYLGPFSTPERAHCSSRIGRLTPPPPSPLRPAQ